MVIASAEMDEITTPALATPAEKIMALLSSKHFNVIYDLPYKGSEESIIALLQQCESLIDTISLAVPSGHLEAAIQIADGSLITVLPAAEIRNLTRAIVEKDQALVDVMPQLRKILWRVLRAIEISIILDSSVLFRLAADIVNHRRWGKIQ
jgi:uncharacterized protein YjaG (DUF416 family)